MTALGRPGTPGMRERWMRTVIEYIDLGYLRSGSVTDSELVVTAYAFAFASTIRGENALMSVPMLVRRTRLSRRRAMKARDLLLLGGALEVQQSGHGSRHGTGKATTYRLSMPTGDTLNAVYCERVAQSRTSTATSADVVDVETSTATSADVVEVQSPNVNHFSSNVNHVERADGRPSVPLQEPPAPEGRGAGAAAPLAEARGQQPLNDVADDAADDAMRTAHPRPPWHVPELDDSVVVE